MLGSWFMSCMTDNILKQITIFGTTRDGWVKLEKSYASKPRARAILVKYELQRLKKGNMSILNYMLQIKLITYKLDVDGCGMSDEEKLVSFLVA